MHPQGVHRNCQRGVVLIVALLLLTLMALVTFSTYNGTVLEERMAGNASSRNQAFQIAEFVLRDAERKIDSNFDNTSASCTPDALSAPLPLLYDDTTTPPGEQPVTWWINNQHFLNTSFPSDWKIPMDISAKYTIEKKTDTPTPPTIYRITARVSGYGGSTVVVLESTYACN